MSAPFFLYAKIYLNDVYIPAAVLYGLLEALAEVVYRTYMAEENSVVEALGIVRVNFGMYLSTFSQEIFLW